MSKRLIIFITLGVLCVFAMMAQAAIISLGGHDEDNTNKAHFVDIDENTKDLESLGDVTSEANSDCGSDYSPSECLSPKKLSGKVSNAVNCFSNCTCPSKYKHECTDVNEDGGLGLECDGKFEFCICAPNYEWDHVGEECVPSNGSVCAPGTIYDATKKKCVVKECGVSCGSGYSINGIANCTSYYEKDETYNQTICPTYVPRKCKKCQSCANGYKLENDECKGCSVECGSGSINATLPANCVELTNEGDARYDDSSCGTLTSTVCYGGCAKCKEGYILNGDKCDSCSLGCPENYEYDSNKTYDQAYDSISKIYPAGCNVEYTGADMCYKCKQTVTLEVGEKCNLECETKCVEKEACTNLPANASWTTKGTCDWECKTGYKKDGNACALASCPTGQKPRNECILNQGWSFAKVGSVVVNGQDCGTCSATACTTTGYSTNAVCQAGTSKKFHATEMSGDNKCYICTNCVETCVAGQYPIAGENGCVSCGTCISKPSNSTWDRPAETCGWTCDQYYKKDADEKCVLDTDFCLRVCPTGSETPSGNCGEKRNTDKIWSGPSFCATITPPVGEEKCYSGGSECLAGEVCESDVCKVCQKVCATNITVANCKTYATASNEWNYSGCTGALDPNTCKTSCSACNSGFELSADGKTCTNCTEECGSGFEPEAGANGCNTCKACPSLVANAYRPTPGSCDWSCNAGYQKNAAGTACEVSDCPSGQTPKADCKIENGYTFSPRSTIAGGKECGICSVASCPTSHPHTTHSCNLGEIVVAHATAMSGGKKCYTCQACTKPTNSYWTTNGTCDWECNSGYIADNDQCVLDTRSCEKVCPVNSSLQDNGNCGVTQTEDKVWNNPTLCAGETSTDVSKCYTEGTPCENTQTCYNNTCQNCVQSCQVDVSVANCQTYEMTNKVWNYNTCTGTLEQNVCKKKCSVCKNGYELNASGQCEVSDCPIDYDTKTTCGTGLKAVAHATAMSGASKCYRCEACPKKPDNSSWTTGVCTWSCNQWYKKDSAGINCDAAPCPTSGYKIAKDLDCEVGHKAVVHPTEQSGSERCYICQSCGRLQNGMEWSTPGTCDWKCKDGYKLNSDSTFCLEKSCSDYSVGDEKWQSVTCGPGYNQTTDSNTGKLCYICTLKNCPAGESTDSNATCPAGQERVETGNLSGTNACYKCENTCNYTFRTCPVGQKLSNEQCIKYGVTYYKSCDCNNAEDYFETDGLTINDTVVSISGQCFRIRQSVAGDYIHGTEQYCFDTVELSEGYGGVVGIMLYGNKFTKNTYIDYYRPDDGFGSVQPCQRNMATGATVKVITENQYNFLMNSYGSKWREIGLEDNGCYWVATSSDNGKMLPSSCDNGTMREVTCIPVNEQEFLPPY